MFAGNFAPRGWAFCDGQLLAVSQNDALFSLLGTIYGGDGRTTFGLPDLRGRIPIHAGSGPGLSVRRLGSKAGSENVTLTTNQIPPHRHVMQGTAASATTSTPSGLMGAPTDLIYWNSASNSNVSGSIIANAGGSQHHTNLMPTLCVNFIIALVGIYPSRN